MAGRAKVNSARAIAAAWDRQCEAYVHDLGQVTGRKCLAAVERGAIERELGDREGVRVLDAACGPGAHGIALARAGHRVTLADLSARMLERARVDAAEAGVGEAIEIVRCDIRDTGLEEASFDVIVSGATAVSDCGDTSAAIVEFGRLLAPGGLAMFSVRNLWAALDWWARYCDPADVRGWIEAGRRTIPQGHEAFDWTFFTREGLREVCREAGMELVHVYPVGMLRPPESEQGLGAYVSLHLDLVDDASAIARAQEIFAAAKKEGLGARV